MTTVTTISSVRKQKNYLWYLASYIAGFIVGFVFLYLHPFSQETEWFEWLINPLYAYMNQPYFPEIITLSVVGLLTAYISYKAKSWILFWFACGLATSPYILAIIGNFVPA